MKLLSAGFKVVIWEVKQNFALLQLIVQGQSEKIVINAKPFSQKALQQIATAMIENFIHAKIDPSLNKWAEKDYKNLRLSWRNWRDLFLPC